MSTVLSLSETAQKHGVSKSSLSEAVHDGRPVRDMNLHRYAVIEDARIQKFRFPSWYNFPNEREKKHGGKTVFMTLPEICEQYENLHLGKVEEALRSGRQIANHNISDWAVRDEEGSIEGLEVPKDADLDGPCHFRDSAEEGGPESTAQSALEKREEPLQDGKHRANPDAARSFSALAGAAIFKLLTS